MSKKPKQSKIPSGDAVRARERFARNLRELIDQQYPAPRFKTRSARDAEFAREAHVKVSTVQRHTYLADHPQIGSSPPPPTKSAAPTLDVIADYAAVFGVSPAELLTPNFAAGRRRETPGRDEPDDSRELRRV